MQHPGKAFLQAVDHDPAGRGHGPHQVMELAFDRGEVVEDVGVVELQVVQDCGARSVVHELAALVEEGGVVLVGLDHEVSPGAQSCRDAEIHWHAADQETRLQAGLRQHPGQH